MSLDLTKFPGATSFPNFGSFPGFGTFGGSFVGGIPWDYGFGLTPAPKPEEKKAEPPKEEKAPEPAPAPAAPAPAPEPSPALKLITEVLAASQGLSQPADGEKLSLGDALEFYEWLREKRRRQNLAKLF